MSVRIIQGDVRDVLPTLPLDYFDCIVTSPPYFGLRDYGCAGQIGLEPTLDGYLETMVAVCRELRRVLKPSGVLFLNIGDSYTQPSSGRTSTDMPKNRVLNDTTFISRKIPTGMKPKDLCLVPERLGIALQADGWWVRSRIVWAKPNPMPESVTDRPTSAHETIWMLTKSAKYFWDGEAVKDEASTFERQRSFGKSPKIIALEENGTHGKGGNLGVCYDYQSRNMRNVWTIATHPFPGAHFATMPPEIAERCIKAGSSERGCCPACGAPWLRMFDLGEVQSTGGSARGARAKIEWRGEVSADKQNHSMFTGEFKQHDHVFKGWKKTCGCTQCYPLDKTRILDPFAGSGTVGLVADRLGRDATLIDLNTSYINMAVNRIRDDAPLFAEVAAE